MEHDISEKRPSFPGPAWSQLKKPIWLAMINGLGMAGWVELDRTGVDDYNTYTDPTVLRHGNSMSVVFWVDGLYIKSEMRLIHVDYWTKVTNSRDLDAYSNTKENKDLCMLSRCSKWVSDICKLPFYLNVSYEKISLYFVENVIHYNIVKPTNCQHASCNSSELLCDLCFDFQWHAYTHVCRQIAIVIIIWECWYYHTIYWGQWLYDKVVCTVLMATSLYMQRQVTPCTTHGQETPAGIGTTTVKPLV